MNGATNPPGAGHGLWKSLGDRRDSERRGKQGERFGTGVSLATAVMAAIAMHRGHMERMETLWMVSASLLFLALVLPRALHPAAWILEEAFKTVTKTLMYILLVLVFILVFSPVGIMLRLLSRDILEREIQPDARSYWSERKPRDPSRTEKQF
jgi:hypothetical protein